MTFLSDKYYIIRIGDFATNGNRKILYCLFVSGLCTVDSFYNSNDCIYIMIGSSLVWTIIEALLYITNTRKIKQMYISYNGKRLILSPYTGIVLQGTQEGGVVTTFGLFFGDRLFNYKYIILLHSFIFFIIRDILNNTTDTTILSKRQINTKSSLFLMGSVTLYNLKNLYENPDHIHRQMKMFFTIIYVCTIWTVVAVYKNRRKVEIVSDDTAQEITKQNEIFILGYDVIFEIGIAYLTFYNLFVIK
jgi:hypothetical protein